MVAAIIFIIFLRGRSRLKLIVRILLIVRIDGAYWQTERLTQIRTEKQTERLAHKDREKPTDKHIEKGRRKKKDTDVLQKCYRQTHK